MRRQTIALAAALALLPAAARPDTQHYGAWTIYSDMTQLDYVQRAAATTPALGADGVFLVVGCRSDGGMGVALALGQYLGGRARVPTRWKFDSGPVHSGTLQVVSRTSSLSLEASRAVFLAGVEDAHRLVIEVEGVELAFDLTGADGAVGSARSICGIP